MLTTGHFPGQSSSVVIDAMKTVTPRRLSLRLRTDRTECQAALNTVEGRTAAIIEFRGGVPLT